MSDSEDSIGDIFEIMPCEEITAMGLIDLNAVVMFISQDLRMSMIC